MKHIHLTGKIIMKVLEVGHWVAVGLMGAVAVLSQAAPQLLKYVMDVDSLLAEKEVSAYGLSVTAVDAAGQLDRTTLLLFAIGAVAIFVLMALVFRNFHRVIKNAQTDTPFSQENVRRMKRIGLNCILVSLLGFVFSNVIVLVAGPDATQASMDHSFLIMGIIVWCLTEFFAYGAKLESDVDGLV